MDEQICCYRAIYCTVPEWKKAAPHLLLGSVAALAFSVLVWAVSCALCIEPGSAIAVTLLVLAALAASSWALIRLTDALFAFIAR